MSNTATAPRTYAAAADIAEEITVDELAEMIGADNNPDIFPGPRRPRRIAMDAKMSEFCAAVTYHYGNRNGRLHHGASFLGRHNPPVFRFNNGRTVKVVR